MHFLRRSEVILILMIMEVVEPRVLMLMKEEFEDCSEGESSQYLIGRGLKLFMRMIRRIFLTVCVLN